MLRKALRNKKATRLKRPVANCSCSLENFKVLTIINVFVLVSVANLYNIPQSAKRNHHKVYAMRCVLAQHSSVTKFRSRDKNVGQCKGAPYHWLQRRVQGEQHSL